MPRRQRDLAPVVPLPTRSLVASATRYDGKTARIYNESQDWQREAYRHYRICGEARFAAQFFGHALSKATLYIASDPKDLRSPPLENGPAVDALDQLFNGSEGQAAMLASIGTHLTVAGECYLIGRTDEDGNEIWEIRSIIEVKSNGTRGASGKWWILQGGSQNLRIELKPDDVVIRIWTPDPANAINADSPFRSLLPILEEIEWLTKYVFAQCSSRLAGAGVWMVPEEIDFPPAPDQPNNKAVDRGKADGLMQTLADAMMKPLEDPSNPASKVPIVVTAPGEHIGKQEWVQFWSELDTEAKGLRQEAIQRFALGMDLPPERILGMSNSATMGAGGSGNGVSHWGAWQIDEDTIKMHVEPMLDVVTMAMTISYVRPTSDDPTAMVRYDTSTLRLRPDRSAEAIELYDRGLIKAEVVVKENGFDESEMMDAEEQQRWFIMKVASGSATPDMVAEALRMLGVAMPDPPDSMGQLNDARPDPSIEDHPNRDIPDREAAALIAASEGLVFRALERAGNRLKGQGIRPPDTRSHEVHTAVALSPAQAKHALTDAWSCAPQVLNGVVEDIDGTIKHLDSYATSLLLTAKPHTREALTSWLTKRP